MKHARSILAAIWAASMVVPAIAQSPYRVEVRVEPHTIRPGEEATIRLLAHFDASRDCAVAFVITDLMVSIHATSIEHWGLLPPMDKVFTFPGTVDEAGVRDIVAFQLHGLSDIVADQTNPMPFWEGTFVAPFETRARRIILATRTAGYEVYLQCCMRCAHSEQRIDEMDEGFATLWIVSCLADIDGDGELTVFDFLAFQNLFAAGDLRADFDGDGELTVFDFLAFQNAFERGCE